MKINENTMREQYDGQYKTFCKKNSDYGASFEESLSKHGIVASIIRMGDKMNRLEALTDDSRTQQVGSESLLDTLEDLSNYAAMTACWLKGIRDEDEVSGPDMEDVIKYNVQDAKDTIKFRVKLKDEFKPLSSKIENIDPRSYVLNMLSNIFRVVGKKIEKNEILVPLDISDEAGLIAKAIVESQTEEEGCAVINNYMCTRKDIPYELKDWVYGVIMRYFYYLKKERSEEETICIMGDDKPILIRKNVKDIIPDDDNVVDAMRYRAEDMMNDPIVRKRINEEIISNSLGAIIELMADDIKRQRDPKVKLDERQIIVDQRQKYYEKIARFIRIAPNIEFQDFVNYIRIRSDLHSYEQQLLCEGVAMEIYSQTDKNPGGEEESEFRSKTFNIPTEEISTENLTFKPQDEEKEQINERLIKNFLWLFHPIIDKDYRGGSDE